jgi:hypothetical protein
MRRGEDAPVRREICLSIREAGISARQDPIGHLDALLDVVPDVVQGGDRDVAAVPHDLDDAGLREDAMEVRHIVLVRQRGLVDGHSRAGLGQPPPENGPRDGRGRLQDLLFDVRLTRPHRCPEPRMQILGLAERGLQRAGARLRRDERAAEEPALSG